jgi:8-oxo-dGTP pyrophosphatase MutT (NUDIX family)
MGRRVLQARRRAVADRLTHAGAVVFRAGEEGARFLVISSSDGLNWVLPKGHIEPGEAPEETVRRELEEETGVTGELLSTLTVQEFEKRDESVRVQYFLVRATATKTAGEGRELVWLDAAAAWERLSFPDAREALRIAADRVANLGRP